MSLKPGCIVDTYNSGGTFTWTKRAGAKSVSVKMIGGGSGGQAGYVRPTGTPQFSSGGAYGELTLEAALLGATESVIVGAGGAGNTGGAGGLGVAGGNSSFGKYFFVRGGANNSFAAMGSPGGNTTAQAPNFANNSQAGGNTVTLRAGGTGGLGGQITTPGVITNPQNGGGNIPASASNLPGNGVTGAFTGVAGGVAGVLGTPNGGNGQTFVTNAALGGGGGGGGFSALLANGGNGGNGGHPGGGGGGGGTGDTAMTGGNGGNGADGIVIVTTYF